MKQFENDTQHAPMLLKGPFLFIMQAVNSLLSRCIKVCDHEAKLAVIEEKRCLCRGTAVHALVTQLALQLSQPQGMFISVSKLGRSEVASCIVEIEDGTLRNVAHSLGG